MSSYKAYGSVSANQIAIQRKDSDSYYGELLLLHPYNGKSYTDELLEDIKVGITATYRKYRHQAMLNNFETRISLFEGGLDSGLLPIIQESYPDAVRLVGDWGTIPGLEQSLALASASPLQYSVGETTKPSGLPGSGAIGYITTPAALGYNTVEVSKHYIGPNGNLFMDLIDDGTGSGFGYTGFDTEINASMASKEGFFGVITTADAATVGGQKPKTRSFYYFSTDSRLNVPFEAKTKLDAYACISIQDNGNNEEPYYQLGKNHPEFIRRDKVLSSIGIDFEEMSKQVFDPTPIPALGSEEWNQKFKPGYDASPELQSKYRTEADYRKSLADDQAEMKKGIKNITDVHFGMFVNPVKLDTASAYALKGFFKDILPNLPPPKSLYPISESTYDAISFNIASGSLKIAHTLSGYKFGRRVGNIKDYKPKGVTMHVKNKEKVCFGITETNPENAGAPDNGFDDGTGDYSPGIPLPNMEGVGAIYIATVSAPDANGNPTYEFIELYKPFAIHHIDVTHDGEHGTSQAVDIRGGLYGYNGDEYSNVLLYPITVNARKVVPIFKRERLIRETSMLIIDGIQVVKIKWYQTGIFKVLFFIVGAIASCLFSACTTVALLIAGDTAAWTALATYVLEAAAVGVGLTLLLSAIDNPLLAALVMIIAGVMLGPGISKMSYMDMATLAVEATNTYMQKAYAEEIIKLEEEAKELRKKYKEQSEKMDSIEEEAGMTTSVDSDWILQKASMPPPGQYPEDFYSKSLKTDFAIINQDNGISAVLDIRLPNIKEIKRKG